MNQEPEKVVPIRVLSLERGIELVLKQKLLGTRGKLLLMLDFVALSI